MRALGEKRSEFLFGEAGRMKITNANGERLLGVGGEGGVWVGKKKHWSRVSGRALATDLEGEGRAVLLRMVMLIWGQGEKDSQ